MLSGSPSSRRAWIEILEGLRRLNDCAGRSPRGGRGLKFGELNEGLLEWDSRSPRGGRGLKLFRRQAPG